ncbi:hypothetical protein [Marinobacterium jannaschii]|uniref:hypothetical protein n=1 Tax=Marinobacterium jannaschii TaxID=64970 RepID=UPI0004882A6A|nr:hypothetical protein [Marinobacterium jannaschii]
MKALTFTALLMAGSGYADTEIQLIDQTSDSVIMVITSEERFDPLVQQLLVKQQLTRHRYISEPQFLVIHNGEEQSLSEGQIRYLEQLLAREEE